jgi:hypothetical protein
MLNICSPTLKRVHRIFRAGFEYLHGRNSSRSIVIRQLASAS